MSFWLQNSGEGTYKTSIILTPKFLYSLCSYLSIIQCKKFKILNFVFSEEGGGGETEILRSGLNKEK